MEARFEPMIEQFRRDQPTFRLILETALRELNAIAASCDFQIEGVAGRVKTERSLIGKFERKGQRYHQLEDLTDLVGVRVITCYADDVDRVAEKVREVFDVNWEYSDDKRALMDVNTFGYLSLHYICRLPKSLCDDPRLPLANEYYFEVQMRSALQHVWAEMVHDTGYKSDVEVPREYLRSHSRLSGLLELADDEFIRIRDGLERYRKDARVLIQNNLLDRVDLNADTFALYLERRPFDELVQRIASINDMEVEDANLSSFLPILRSLGLQTLGDLDAMLKECEDDALQLARSQFEGTDIDIVSSTVALRNLCFAYEMRKDTGYAGLFDIYRMMGMDNEAARRRALRMLERGKALGLVQQ